MKAPAFWYRHSGLESLLLSPFGQLYRAAGKVRRWLTTPYRASIPVYCVGNIVAGGAGKTPTALALAALLQARGTKRVFCCGLATDFCVAFSALDAREAGFEAFVIEDACRAIDAGGSLATAWARMEAAGVRRIFSWEILG